MTMELDVIRRKLEESKEYFAKVEALLKSAGAKTWSELFPSDETGDYDSYNYFGPGVHCSSNTPDFKYYRLDNQGNHTLVPSHHFAAYDELFQACFDGDNAKVERLCLPKGTVPTKHDLLQITVEFGRLTSRC